MTVWTWEDLAAHTAARQFPRDEGDLGVAALVDRTGPIQSQTARSPFVGLAARRPGLTREAVAAAYASHSLVRGSTLRGTVHTCTPRQHATLDAVTRVGQRALHQRTLRPGAPLEDLWAATEAYAATTWRTPAELGGHLHGWLTEHDPPGSPPRRGDAMTRALAFGHGGLVRRPVGGVWEGQGAAEYRSAAHLLGDRRPPLPNADDAMDQAVREHLAAHGPATRHDLAWWAGVGLRVVDAALERLAGELTERIGPGDQVWHDLAHGVPGPVDPAALGVRLLPEFDALVCAYAPSGRDRFVDPAHHAHLFRKENGLFLPMILRGGRLTGHWRLGGPPRSRTLTLTWFRGTGRLGRREVRPAVDALATGLGITIAEVEIVAAR